MVTEENLENSEGYSQDNVQEPTSKVSQATFHHYDFSMSFYISFENGISSGSIIYDNVIYLTVSLL